MTDTNPHVIYCGLCPWCGPERSTESETLVDAVDHYSEQHPESSFVSWWRRETGTAPTVTPIA